MAPRALLLPLACSAALLAAAATPEGNRADAFAERASRALAAEETARLLAAPTPEAVDLPADHALRAVYEQWHAWAHEGEGDDEAPSEGRFRAFAHNAAYVSNHKQQQQAKPYRIGLGYLADLSHDEFLATRLGVNDDAGRARVAAAAAVGADPSPGHFVPAPKNFRNTSVDWREEPNVAVTSVKNQKQCGSCWSFSAAAAIEGVQALATETYPPVSLSEQELLDCDLTDLGCGGGLMDNAFKWVAENGGLDTYKDWSYEAKRDYVPKKPGDKPFQPRKVYCDPKREKRDAATIDGHEDVLPKSSEIALMEAVQKQPVSIAIQANHRDFQLYSGGIFADGGCGEQLDHGVLLAGYGTDEAGNDYWLIKNSWSANWGEEGYIRVATGVPPAGMCGLTAMASVPIKKHGHHPSPPPAPPAPPSPPPPPPPPPPGPRTPCTSAGSIGPSCEDGQTCCCVFEEGKRCLIWGCCQFKNAVCCDDHRHCCPSDYPVCEDGGRCGGKNTKAGVHAGFGVPAWVPAAYLKLADGGAAAAAA